MNKQLLLKRLVKLYRETDESVDRLLDCEFDSKAWHREVDLFNQTMNEFIILMEIDEEVFEQFLTYDGEKYKE